MLGWMFYIIHATWTSESCGRKEDRPNVEPGYRLSKDGCGVRSSKDEEMIRAIEAGVVGLPESQRIVMLLVAIEGLSYAHAAQILDLPVSTVVCRLSRARQSIGALLNDRRLVEA
jgi:RNA polymerase sigma-70 factor, ECF subfamily